MTRHESSPVVSLCIPTFNRSQCLQSLLPKLKSELSSFRHSFEVVIADNASDDDTSAVISTFENDLPIRRFRHEVNIGGYPNFLFVTSQARGEFVVYLADDDRVLGDQLADAIDQMLALPEVGVAYSPWILFDEPSATNQGEFYSQAETLLVPRGDFAGLLNHILQHGIWPEISIVRRSILQRSIRDVPETVFGFFAQAGEYLAKSSILLLKQPFYVSIVRHFEGDTRSQIGVSEVKQAWDRYRGGLEYLLARAAAAITTETHCDFLLRINRFVGERISTAIRLRIQGSEDPVEIFYLAVRATALGLGTALPEPMIFISAKAALTFVARDPQLNYQKTNLVFIGEFASGMQDFLLKLRPGQVSFSPSAPALATLKNALVVLGKGREGELTSSQDELARLNIRVVYEADLMEKFLC